MFGTQALKMIAAGTGPLVFLHGKRSGMLQTLSHTKYKYEERAGYSVGIRWSWSSVVLFVTKKILDEPFDIIVTRYFRCNRQR